MDSFLTWQYVATFAGIVFATNLFVNFTKELPYIKDMPTKYYTSIIAFILILMSNLSMGAFDVRNIPLIVLNSIIITFTATGSYDFIDKKVTDSKIVDTTKSTTSGINILSTINTETK